MRKDRAVCENDLDDVFLVLGFAQQPLGYLVMVPQPVILGEAEVDIARREHGDGCELAVHPD